MSSLWQIKSSNPKQVCTNPVGLYKHTKDLVENILGGRTVRKVLKDGIEKSGLI
jgi:hypothetical protein